MKNLYVLAKEPTPYSIDAFNALAENSEWSVDVLFATARNWAPDAGHQFERFPNRKFCSRENHGRGLQGQLMGLFKISRDLLMHRPDAMIIWGYAGAIYIAALLLAILLKIPFALFSDRFNVMQPQIANPLAPAARAILRRLTFRHAFAILVCGVQGRKTAIDAGCPPEKVIDFPYVVSGERLLELAHQTAVKMDLSELGYREDRPIIFYSGRHIRRKGLDVLLRALWELRQEQVDYFALIEGEGPLRRGLEELALQLDLTEDVVFLGFRQMDEHAYFLSVADVVVVPSIDDPWGIVVHEGMLLGKAVCASDAVGSAVDRIKHCENGLLFRSSDPAALARTLKQVLLDKDWRHELGESGQQVAQYWSPARNSTAFYAAYSSYCTQSKR